MHSTDGSRGGAPQDLGPEARLLFLTAGYPRTEPALRGLLEARLDWETVAFLAERENATLVVSRYLRAAGDREVPAAVVLPKIHQTPNLTLALLRNRV